jgi:hypothetical protein
VYIQADELVRDRIPIKESVRKLEEAFPHLKDVKWNEKADIAAREKRRRMEKEKNGKVAK